MSATAKPLSETPFNPTITVEKFVPTPVRSQCRLKLVDPTGTAWYSEELMLDTSQLQSWISTTLQMPSLGIHLKQAERFNVAKQEWEVA